MSEKPPKFSTFTAEIQIWFQYRVVHGTDPSKKSSLQKAVTKSLSLQGLAFDSPRVDIDGFHLSFTEASYGRNSLEIKLDLGKRFGEVEVVGQVEWYERRMTAAGPGFSVGVGFTNMTADATAILREYLQAGRSAR
jgi:hypothetical protein